ncbi:MAG TPA: PAS domain-containing protein, partial [Myxococcales bacterium]|nr:PAS domain-containing protein [Myxococcales bacterium]
MSPRIVAAGDSSCWDLSGAVRTHEIKLAGELEARFGPLPSGAWRRTPRRAALVPITASGQTGHAGVLVAGLNPFRLFDLSYRRFLDLVSSQISAGLTAARAYQQERERAEALAELDRAKTVFFSNISHEFRTPLTLMLGPTEDLLAGAHGAVPDQQREQLQLLHRSGLRLQKLVNSLLDFSRLEAGRIHASYQPTDLAALTRDLASTFRSTVERAGLTLEIRCPPLEEPVFVDREMWEKIVLNLLSNAFKFTFEGGVEVSLADAGPAVALRVKDTGVGVPEAELERIFERFHRVEGTRARTNEGSGIGLALVQELAKLHGGSAQAESRVGQGTTFTVTIPKGSAHLPGDRIGAERLAASTALAPAAFVQEVERWLPGDAAGAAPAPAGGPRARVLLADDNADMRDYVRRILEAHWTVEAVEDGTRALEAARARPPDLVLTDVMMPGLDGFELLRELRANDPTRSVPVVMLSARAGEEARVEGLTAGAEDYLVKPFSARELLARVRTHLELARLRKETQAQLDYLYTLLMKAPAAICVVRGPDLVYEMANDHYLRLVGGGHVTGKRLLEVLPQLRGEGFDDLFLHVMRTGETFVGLEMLIRLPGLDGTAEETYWNFVYAPLEGPDGVARVVALGNDVTEQVLTRRLVEQSEERFRRIVDQVQAGIAQMDLSGRIALTNDRFRELAGRSASELQQLRLQDIIHPEDVSAHLEDLQRLVLRGTPFVSERRYVRPDGSMVWVQHSVSRIDDRRGRPQGLVSVALDVTQRKFAEQALKEAQTEREARLAEIERALLFSETFVGMLGHDLRN